MLRMLVMSDVLIAVACLALLASRTTLMSYTSRVYRQILAECMLCHDVITRVCRLDISLYIAACMRFPLIYKINDYHAGLGLVLASILNIRVEYDQ